MKKSYLITTMALMILMVSIPSESYSATPAGPLSVSGNKIVDKNGQPVSFAGMSLFWSNDGWGGERYWNEECINWLVKDWKVTIIRAAMGVEDGGGYLGKPKSNKKKLKRVVDACIAAGIYVIIDWHSHHAERHRSKAVEFFKEMARTYGGYDNIIYEVYNEPLSGKSWKKHVKPYAEAVIKAIREIDPDNIIAVGSPEWSQRVDQAAKDPIKGYKNICYTIHMYPDMGHTGWLRSRCKSAMKKGIALMATEWGPKGYLQHKETDKWMELCKTWGISHTAWAVNDKKEPWSILKKHIGMTKGGWADTDLSTRGLVLRDICRNWSSAVGEVPPPSPPPPPPEGDNLALNQPTECSSTEKDEDYKSGNAVDGDASTRWK